MPKLLVQKKVSKKSAREKQYVAPFSPFQKLIHSAMETQCISGRQLAEKLDAAGAPAGQSTIWIWLHTPNGHPHTKSFKKSHALGLAKVLGIPPQKVLDSLDASRHIYTRKEAATPAPTFDGLAALEEIVRGGTSTYVRRSFILNRIEMIRRGCSA